MLATETTKQILIVDRDVATVEPLRQKLGEAGFKVRTITDISAAVVAAADLPPSLLIIDWNDACFASFEVIEWLRKARSLQTVRLIVLSELSGEEYVVNALNLGADDYIVKPFSLREAIARIFAVMRANSHAIHHQALRCGDLVLDSATNRVMARGEPMSLRGAEYRLLEFLMTHAGRTFDRSQLLSRVWGGDTGVDERTVDVNVQRLRKILAGQGYEAYIQTVRGFGYRFGSPGASD